MPSGLASRVLPSSATLLASSMTPRWLSSPPSSTKLNFCGMSAKLHDGSCIPLTSGTSPAMLAMAVASTWALVPSRKELYIFKLMLRRCKVSSSKPNRAAVLSGVPWGSSAKRMVPRPAATTSKPRDHAHSMMFMVTPG